MGAPLSTERRGALAGLRPDSVAPAANPPAHQPATGRQASADRLLPRDSLRRDAAVLGRVPLHAKLTRGIK
ncbi:jg4204 [Pararge aegeria aegeria]|uniref:Jg4204 protein n=1 Tax=Pararge aegeria aegeria TaxID=348720 RepID=A0A8S4R4R6_9NEOP|nr:jg4204 [Pararge aegeria aegeria]